MTEHDPDDLEALRDAEAEAVTHRVIEAVFRESWTLHSYEAGDAAEAIRPALDQAREAGAEEAYAAMAKRLDENASLRRRLARLEDVETGRAACCTEHETALRSIASALGMSADALPGAIVERAEQFARAAEQLDALRTAHVDGWRDIRATLGARDGEQTRDAAMRVRRERDEAEAALMTAQAERDSLGEVIAQTRTALGAGDAESTPDAAVRVIDAARADLAALLAAADHVDATARAAEGAGPAEREAAREARHELRRVVAELRAGVPAGVLVSREDAAVVRAVLAAAERGHAIAGEGREGDAWDESGLEDAVCDYERAGRPLASKEGA